MKMPSTPDRLRLLAASGLLFAVSSLTFALPVVPGAIGYGSDATAGRGTTSVPAVIYKVTDLSDPTTLTAGTLRYGIEHSSMNKARVIIFEKSGVIALREDLVVRPGFGALTIAGQTAPAPGITIRNAGFDIQTGNILIQHIAVRPGTGTGEPISNRDCFKMAVPAGQSADKIVIDHVSMSWATDETNSVYSNNGPVTNITHSNSLFYDPVQNSGHPDGQHGFGSLIGPNSNNTSYIRNIMAFQWGRNPLTSSTADNAQIVNNFIYRPGPNDQSAMAIGVADSQELDWPQTVSAINNVVLRHPAFSFNGTNYSSVSSTGFRVVTGASTNIDLYLSGNTLYNPANNTWYPGAGSQFSSPFFSSAVSLTQRSTDPHDNSGGVAWEPWLVSALEAKLLSTAGKQSALRDALDSILLAKIVSRTGTFLASLTTTGNHWAPVDIIKTRTLTTPASPQSDTDGDGYTLLEEWLHDHAFKVEGDRRIASFDTFADGNSTGWFPDTAVGSWSIVTDGSSVLKQSTTSGSAAAFLVNTNFYDQVVRARVKPVDLTSSSFVRVFARYRDLQNGYYVTLRDTNIVEVKKLLNGVVSSTVVASAPLTITEGAWYDVRLSVVAGAPGAATTISATVTNVATPSQTVTIQTTDVNPLGPGFAAVGTLNASAHFENVFASPFTTATPQLLEDFDDGNATGWTATGGSWSVPAVTPKVYKQSTTTSGLAARTAWNTTVASANQSVQADVKPIGMTSGTSSFVSIHGRYSNAYSNYYMTLRNNRNVELKKVTGGVSPGTVTTLGTVITLPGSFDLSTWHNMRLEITGSNPTTLKGYIDGELVVSGSDSSSPITAANQAGIGTYSIAAEFDDVIVTAP